MKIKRNLSMILATALLSLHAASATAKDVQVRFKDNVATAVLSDKAKEIPPDADDIRLRGGNWSDGLWIDGDYAFNLLLADTSIPQWDGGGRDQMINGFKRDCLNGVSVVKVKSPEQWGYEKGASITSLACKKDSAGRSVTMVHILKMDDETGVGMIATIRMIATASVKEGVALNGGADRLKALSDRTRDVAQKVRVTMGRVGR